MFKMQYIVPPTFPAPDGKLDKAVANLGASLRGVDRKWTVVPNTALKLKLNVFMDGASLEIQKRDQFAYINIFCFNGHHSQDLLTAVDGLYKIHNLGSAKRPITDNWIHSIPVGFHLLRENEIRLCEKLTVSFYWAAYSQQLSRVNPLN